MAPGSSRKSFQLSQPSGPGRSDHFKERSQLFGPTFLQRGLEEGARRAAADAQAGAGQAQHLLHVDGCSVTCMFVKLIVIFRVQKSKAP